MEVGSQEKGITSELHKDKSGHFGFKQEHFGVMWESLWDPLGIISGHLGVIWEPHRGLLGSLRSVWHHLGVTLEHPESPGAYSQTLWNSFWATSGSLGSHMGALWRHLAALWGHLEALWGDLETLWGHLEALWGDLGVTLEHFEVSWRSLWNAFGPLLCQLQLCECYSGVTFVHFQEILILPMNFNDFIQLLNQLGTTWNTFWSNLEIFGNISGQLEATCKPFRSNLGLLGAHLGRWVATLNSLGGHLGLLSTSKMSLMCKNRENRKQQFIKNMRHTHCITKPFLEQ